VTEREWTIPELRRALKLLVRASLIRGKASEPGDSKRVGPDCERAQSEFAPCAIRDGRPSDDGGGFARCISCGWRWCPHGKAFDEGCILCADEVLKKRWLRISPPRLGDFVRNVLDIEDADALIDWIRDADAILWRLVEKPEVLHLIALELVESEGRRTIQEAKRPRRPDGEEH